MAKNEWKDDVPDIDDEAAINAYLNKAREDIQNADYSTLVDVVNKYENVSVDEEFIRQSTLTFNETLIRIFNHTVEKRGDGRENNDELTEGEANAFYTVDAIVVGTLAQQLQSEPRVSQALLSLNPVDRGYVYILGFAAFSAMKEMGY